MSSVAASLAATVMNSSFNALKTTGYPTQTDNQEFSQIMQKVNKTSEAASTEITRPVDQGADLKKNQALESDREPMKEEVLTKEVAEAVKEIKEEATEEVASLTTQVGETDQVEEETTEVVQQVPELVQMTAIYEEALQVVSQIVGIPLEELKSFLETEGMTLMDLGDKSKLMTLIQDAFGHDNMVEVLLDSDATKALKEIDAKIADLQTSLTKDFDLTSVQEFVAQIIPTEGKQVQEVQQSVVNDLTAQNLETEKMTSVENEQEPKFQVNDLREGTETSKYDHNQQNGQEQGQQTFGEMISNQLNAIRTTATSVTAGTETYQQVTTSQVIDQIVTKAVVELTDAKSSMQMQLNPEHLGKVAVSITAEQGMVKGQFVTENHGVKEMLETNMIQLKAQLEEQGIKVDKIEVTVGNANQYFNQKDQSDNQQGTRQQKNRSKVGRIRRMMEMDDVDLAEVSKPTEITPELDVHTVEYSA